MKTSSASDKTPSLSVEQQRAKLAMQVLRSFVENCGGDVERHAFDRISKLLHERIS